MTTLIVGSVLGTLVDLLLVLIGFSLIIVVHELGHFLAARWAGIRVLAFALGFGPAIASYRRGMGLQLGSSEKQYRARIAAHGGTPDGPIPPAMASISSTEYRLNWLPLGGYVKMLGQDDADPAARSTARDSYQLCAPWKRMIVISAGVVMNVIAAAILFIVVFSIGLETEPARIGEVRPGSPAARAVAENADVLGITQPGLQPGDTVVGINGRVPDSFKDLAVTVAMAARDEAIALDVQRPGTPTPLRFRIVPETDPASRLLSVGVGPAYSNRLPGGGRRDRLPPEAFENLSARLGLPGLTPGSELVRIGTPPVTPESPFALESAARTSRGEPFPVTFRTPTGAEVSGLLTPIPEMPTQSFQTGDRTVASLPHLLGLVPAMRVEATSDRAAAAGLRAGDVLAQIGGLEWPSLLEGTREIRASAGRQVRIVVLRESADGRDPSLVDLGPVSVGRDGLIGFTPDYTTGQSTLLSRWPSLPMVPLPGSRADNASGTTGPEPNASRAQRPSGAALNLPPGTRILAVDDRPVSTLYQLREALRDTAGAGEGPVSVVLRVRRALPEAGDELIRWTIPPEELKVLRALTWRSPLPPSAFELDQFLLRSDTFGGALFMGLRETHRVMLQTYLTFARLFQGTVKVEHLRGPVGIAHVGTLIADRGLIWLMFLMAVISVNLAVINFLPLPIVDGGHFLFLLWEQLTGRPVSVGVQNVATLAGLLLIGAVFLIVTYNDLARLITGG